MKTPVALFLISGAFSKIEASRHARCFAEQFRIRVGTQESFREVDFRDILKSKPLENALVYGKGRDRYYDSLFKMNDLYEKALRETECCTSESFERHQNLITEKLQSSGCYDLFGEKIAPDEILDLSIPFDLETVHDIFQLLSNWCNEIEISLNSEKIEKILEAFDYLEISPDKEVDIFLERNSKPFHLRIKTINLFCINFVYLLQTQVEDYRSFLPVLEKMPDKNILENFTPDRDAEDRDTPDINCSHAKKARITALIQKIEPLAHFMSLLHLEIEQGYVCHLYLGSGSKYFMYGLLHEQNSKVIILQHECTPTKLSSKLDVIAELNTINKTTVNRRLEILLPFFITEFFLTAPVPEYLEDYYVQSFHRYVSFMSIFNEISEVYIHSVMLEQFAQIPSIDEPDKTMDRLLVLAVRAAIKSLSGLNSLFIDGFNRFPDELVPLLKNTALNKFGVRGYYGSVDFLVIHRLFDEDCPLKNSIAHFIGHLRALLLFCKLRGKFTIEQASIYMSIYGFHTKLYEDEEKYTERIKHHFIAESLACKVKFEQQVEIGTLYYVENKFSRRICNNPLFKPRADNYSSVLPLKEISPEEVLRYCIIRCLITCHDTGLDFVKNITVLDSASISSIKTIELILFQPYDMQELAVSLNQFRNNYSSLILNLDAASLLDHDKYHGFKACILPDICFLFKDYVVENQNDVSLKLKLRQGSSEKNGNEDLARRFKEYYEKVYDDKIEDDKALGIECVFYDENNESAFEKIHL
ncbi:hypothetical protein ENBRE01_1817 [Enteropsectra breve]|nr:hypothetical protein ENBRE01_1817 [Enteropsectra breve]